MDPQTAGRDGAPDVKKNSLKPWLREMWCLPGAPSAGFVCAMEDVLDVYTQPHDPSHPTVCLDETKKQLVGKVQDPLPVAPGKPARFDHHYVRNGVANRFMLLEPLTGRCQVKVTERRSKRDWAVVMKDLVDHHYPEADAITLVVDKCWYGWSRPRRLMTEWGINLRTVL